MRKSPPAPLTSGATGSSISSSPKAGVKKFAVEVEHPLPGTTLRRYRRVNLRLREENNAAELGDLLVDTLDIKEGASFLLLDRAGAAVLDSAVPERYSFARITHGATYQLCVVDS